MLSFVVAVTIWFVLLYIVYRGESWTEMMFQRLRVVHYGLFYMTYVIGRMFLKLASFVLCKNGVSIW